ncbi:MAG: FtsX-like permease family protein [Bacteroidota bacterium]
MIRNLFLVSFRNLLYNRSYTLLHILGLTLGITSALFITMYVIDETGYDNFHTNKSSLYRIITTVVDKDGNEKFYPSTQVPMAEELEAKYAAVERAVRFIRFNRELFEIPDRNLKFYEEKVYYADPSVFEVFSFPVVAGNPKTALVDINSAVLTESTAKRFFGTTDAIDKTFVSKGTTFNVTAIAKDVPPNSSIEFEALICSKNFSARWATWTSFAPETFIMVAGNSTAADVDRALDSVTAANVTPIFEPLGMTIKYFLQPITDIHLKSDFDAEGGGAIEYVYIFLSIGLFVVIVVCINYINLATARATRRAKEIGIRKSIGSTKGNIILQFVAESMLLTMVSLLISVALTFMLLPLFNQLAGKNIDTQFLAQPSIILASIGLALFVGLIGGSYPAFYLSGFNPALVLKGSISGGTANARLRKILVSVQFAISIAMIICTSIVYDQLNYMRHRDLGFNRDQVLYMQLADSATMASEPLLRERLKAYTGVVDVASSASMPGKGINYAPMEVDTEDGKTATQGVYYFNAGYDFDKVMGFTIANGRGFSREYASDSTAALVNEAMVKSLGWKDPIGKRLYGHTRNSNRVDMHYTIVGVVKDFHQFSLHEAIGPVAILNGGQKVFLNLKVKPDDIHGTIDFISKTWREITNGKPFNYTFLDETFEAQYSADVKRGQIFTLFSIACLVISCVGLFGLAAYTTEQRAKEIGIRKVVGASMPSIIKLFYSDFLKLIAIGIVIAFPASYFLMDGWMESFAYQAGMSWLNFVMSALVTLLITMGSISFYAIRAASINPAVTLKTE